MNIHIIMETFYINMETFYINTLNLNSDWSEGIDLFSITASLLLLWLQSKSLLCIHIHFIIHNHFKTDFLKSVGKICRHFLDKANAYLS